MVVSACLFDLDGTLLDTLPDLVRLTNKVLEEQGMPGRTSDEINSFVGSGARNLLEQAAKPSTPDDTIDDMLARWKSLYPEYGHKFTKPYPGIPETLRCLKKDNVKLGVLSNKFDAAVRKVIAEHFPGIFDIARGECENIPRKPNPGGLCFMAESLGVLPSEVVYVGDSGSDMTVALAAGACPVGVSWGYRDASELWDAGARYVIDAPKQLLDVVAECNMH